MRRSEQELLVRWLAHAQTVLVFLVENPSFRATVPADEVKRLRDELAACEGLRAAIEESMDHELGGMHDVF